MSHHDDAPASCCGHAEPAPATTGRHHSVAVTDADDMTTCPVMVGNPVSKQAAEAAGLVRDYDGQRYWLCCAGCGPLFDADPGKYAANMA
ncbi:hypothetical protein [Leucobacter sp. wl10]|uniref:hypothetical protein n=1 Tax=Leucobacter sp. wl10 TaxID=2304677 RepID=UPI000E5B740F|nr:hypothetical protein [Leucobacter sp. wl10]RGE19101.1 hypothetical protein D1J51_13100 [Leucobacter sp. wl10]